MSKRRQRRLMNRRAGFKVNVLSQQTETHSSRTYDLAAIRWLFIVDESKNCRLAGSVSAHQPDMFARVYLKRDATQDILRAIRLINFGETKQHLCVLRTLANRERGQSGASKKAGAELLSLRHPRKPVNQIVRASPRRSTSDWERLRPEKLQLERQTAESWLQCWPAEM